MHPVYSIYSSLPLAQNDNNTASFAFARDIKGYIEKSVPSNLNFYYLTWIFKKN